MGKRLIGSRRGFIPHITRAMLKRQMNMHKLCEGFTMVEIVVMLSIITAISGIVLASFTGLNESSSTNRSSRELALAIRRAQNMSLAVTQIEAGSPPTSQIPPGIGVRLDSTDPTKYFLFADLAPANFKYNGTEEKITTTETIFERRVKINRMVGEAGQEYSTIHVVSPAPEATLFITNESGVAISGDKIDVELISPSGQLKKTVTIRVS